MKIALILLGVQGVIGAFDTLYYHEWKARLPARGALAAPELRLHAARDFLYGVLFCTLPWFQWHGRFVSLLAAVLIAEIVLTLWDFIVEIGVRRSLGDVYASERVTHAIMGILYGAMIANLIPVLAGWSAAPTAFVFVPPDVASWFRWLLTMMGVGVIASGARDLYAAMDLPKGAWPWEKV